MNDEWFATEANPDDDNEFYILDQKGRKVGMLIAYDSDRTYRTVNILTWVTTDTNDFAKGGYADPEEALEDFKAAA